MHKPLHGPQTAGPYLRELLMTRPFRAQWERFATRRTDGPNLAAIAQVIAVHLWETGERHESQEALPRELKDRVGRALGGSVLSPTTLRWFVEAFDIPEVEERELWRLLNEPSSGPVVIRGTAVSPLKLPPRHRTIALHEFHDIGPDRKPATHRTVHVIESLVDHFDSYPYRFDSSLVDVQVLHGGRATASRPDQAGLHAVDIVLSRPIGRGQTASFEYVTRFAYDQPPPPEFRRAAFSPVENLDIRVRFAAEARPARISWCVWEGLGTTKTYEEAVELDDDHGVHRFVRSVVGAVVGFSWSW